MSSEGTPKENPKRHQY